MFAKFDEIPAMTLQDIKETKLYGQMQGRTDGQRENSIPTTNKICGGYKYVIHIVQGDYSKTCINGHSQKDPKLVFKANYRLMQVKSIAECSKGIILQYF